MKCRKPTLYAAEASPLAQKMKKCCSVLSDVFFPSFFFVLSDLQSLTTELAESLGRVSLRTKTTLITLPDGGQISYTEPDCKGDKKMIFFIVPGYIGDHKSYYVQHIAETLFNIDVWPIIFTDRGKGGMPMKTPKLFSAGYNDGLAHLLDTVITANPDSKFGIIGISFGGMVACNTLHNYHRRDDIMLQMLLSTPLDSMKTIARLKAMGRAKILYSIPFGRRIKIMMSNNEEVFKKTKSSKKMFRRLSRTPSLNLTDFDDVFIAPMFGYGNSVEYYQDICLSKTLSKTSTPTVCLNADDDPCFTGDMYPLDVIQKNPNVFLISTSAGGHFGFAGLAWPFSLVTLADKVVTQTVQMFRSEVVT